MQISRTSRSISFALVFSLLAMFLTGCSETPSTQKETEKQTAPIKIGMLISMTADTPFFITLMDGAKKEAQRLGVEVVAEYAADDPALQSRQIQKMMDDKVSAIFINPVDASIVPAIEEANKAGVPVFTFDRGAAGGEIVSHIASDNVTGGEMAGIYMTQALNGKGMIVELEGTENSSAAVERGKGFNRAMSKATEIEIIARESADFNQAKGKVVFASMLADHPQIDGVFAHNDDMILGALAAAREAGREKDIVFVGFDAVEDAVKALQAGDLAATVAQQPAEIGRISIQSAAKHLKGESLPNFIPVDLALITR